MTLVRLNYNQAYFLKSIHNLSKLPEDTGAEVAFIGHSNVGKSSVLCCITQKKLARVGKTPGVTQHINAFALDDQAIYRLIDLPGYGYAKAPISVREKWLERLNSYLKSRQSLKGLILIMDIRHIMKPIDQQVLAWSVSVGLPVHVLLNKSDKLSRGASIATQLKAQKAFRAIKTSITSQLFSAKSGQGLNEVQSFLTRLLLIDGN